MITIFSEQLLDYDVIFRCHSKLSEYSGRQQIESGSYLIAAIIGNSSTFGKHVDAIASGCCDLIAPAPFHGISPIACHSLSNDAALSALYERLGMPAATGFMTYPIGGMFVASQSLFRRLMALGIKLDDFPVEPSRPDGELHHAVERILGTIAGERLSFFDQILQEYCGAKSVLQGEMMRFSPLDDLDEAIFQHQTICFDFFDTLCCRCSGDEEWAKKFVDRIHQSPYRSIRNRAEESIRARSPVGKDVSLTEIVGQLEASQLDNPLRLVGSERAIDFADLRVITPIARSYAKAVSSGKEVLIVSDTYYGADFITSFLDLHSLPRPSQILASSEIGLRKDRGDMWDLIVSRFKRPIIHVGDNVRSDIQAASDRGITAFYVPHWRNALLQTNGLSQTVNALNSHNACFNRFADVVAATTGVLSKDKDVGKVPSEMVSP